MQVVLPEGMAGERLQSAAGLQILTQELMVTGRTVEQVSTYIADFLRIDLLRDLDRRPTDLETHRLDPLARRRIPTVVILLFTISLYFPCYTPNQRLPQETIRVRIRSSHISILTVYECCV